MLWKDKDDLLVVFSKDKRSVYQCSTKIGRAYTDYLPSPPLIQTQTNIQILICIDVYIHMYLYCKSFSILLYVKHLMHLILKLVSI